MSADKQTALWCACGSDVILASGRCARCYAAWLRNRQHFSGLRYRVLERDGRCCVACGRLEDVLVHHRRPGVNRFHLLISLCRRCHGRIHHTWRPAFSFPAALRPLWRELYPGLACQLELSFVEAGTLPGPDSAPEQGLLFQLARAA